MLDFNGIFWIDVKPYLLSKEQPVFLLPRLKAHSDKAWAGSTQIACLGEFWVPNGPVLSDNLDWSCNKTGEFVRVPVFAYKTKRALSSIWGLALQIGMAAMVDLRKHTNIIPKEVDLILGHECTDLNPQEDAFRCYAGISIRVN